MKKNLRLYVKEKIEKGPLILNKKHSHYLKNVMRLKLNDKIYLTTITLHISLKLSKELTMSISPFVILIIFYNIY